MEFFRLNIGTSDISHFTRIGRSVQVTPLSRTLASSP